MLSVHPMQVSILVATCCTVAHGSVNMLRVLQFALCVADNIHACSMVNALMLQLHTAALAWSIMSTGVLTD